MIKVRTHCPQGQYVRELNNFELIQIEMKR